MPKRAAPSATEVTSVLDDLRRIVRVLRESSRRAEQRLGVSGAQLFVLRSLADGAALSINELAIRTRTHQSTVSVVVKRLVEGRLLTRSTSEADARRLVIALSKRGRALLERAPLAAQDKLIEGIQRLPSRQRKVLADSLHALVDAMQLDERPPTMFFEDEAAKSGSAVRPRKRGARRVGA